MKKIFTVLTITALATAINAQQTVVLSENFATYTAGGNTTSTGATAPDSNDIYATTMIAPVANFPTGTKVYSAGGMAKLGTSSVVGSMTSKTLDLSGNGGNVVITFDIKGWTGAGTIIVKVTNKTDQTVSYSAVMAGAPETKTVSFTGGTANSTVTFETPTSSLRAYLDNIEIKTVSGTLAVSDFNISKSFFIKNTSVKNGEIVFGTDAKDVKFYTLSGQIVKTVSVKANETVNISDLAKGNYIVTGTANSQFISQKISVN